MGGALNHGRGVLGALTGRHSAAKLPVLPAAVLAVDPEVVQNRTVEEVPERRRCLHRRHYHLTNAGRRQQHHSPTASLTVNDLESIKQSMCWRSGCWHCSPQPGPGPQPQLQRQPLHPQAGSQQTARSPPPPGPPPPRLRFGRAAGAAGADRAVSGGSAVRRQCSARPGRCCGHNGGRAQWRVGTMKGGHNGGWAQ